MPDKSFWNDQDLLMAMKQWQIMLKQGQFLIHRDTDADDHDEKDQAFDAYWGELGEREKMHNVAG